jgi:hypothetical protein
MKYTLFIVICSSLLLLIFRAPEDSRQELNFEELKKWELVSLSIKSIYDNSERIEDYHCRSLLDMNEDEIILLDRATKINKLHIDLLKVETTQKLHREKLLSIISEFEKDFEIVFKDI